MERLMQGQQPEAPELPESEAEEAEDITEIEDFEPEAQDSTAEEVSEEPEVEEEEEPEAEADEIDLLALSQEEIQDLAKRGKSRLLDRVSKLTAEKRALEAKLEESQSAQPVKREIPQAENPFKDLESFDDIKAKWAEVEQTLEQTDILLDDHEDYGPDDVITVDNQEFTKKQIRQANRNARDAMNKFLPAQADYLKKQESFKQATAHYAQQAEEQVPAIKDEESEIGKLYKQAMADPLIQKIREKVPEAGVNLSLLMAHALNSMHGQEKPKVPEGAGKKLKVKPPASPVGAGTASGGAKPASKAADLMAQASERGNMSQDDLTALLIAKQTQ